MSEKPEVSQIKTFVASGGIKIIRTGQPDARGKRPISGIYASKDAADLFNDTGMTKAPISDESQDKGPYELGNTIYYLSVSDFHQMYHGLDILENAQLLKERDRSARAPETPSFP